MDETIEELREQLLKEKEKVNTLTTSLQQAKDANAKQAERINELTTYNNKLFSRLAFEENEPQKQTEPQTEEDTINAIIKIMNKEEK